MRKLVLALLFLPSVALAQDADAFARALNSGNEHRVDRWVKRELHRQRKGRIVATWESRYTSHTATYDSLVAFMREQPGVLDAAWDKCMTKLALWPGHSRIGVRFAMNGAVHERCYRVQEGRPGQISLFGWRPKARKDKQTLVFKKAYACAGFVEEQRKRCADR